MLRLFLFLIACYNSGGSAFTSDISVVSQFNSTQLDKGLIHFRSLWQYNPTHTEGAGNMFGHACASGVGTEVFEDYVNKYAKIGVVLHRMHDDSAHHKDKTLSVSEEAEWGNLMCTAQVADYFFMHNVLVMNILFVSVNLLIIANLRDTLLNRVSLSNLSPHSNILCMPKQLTLETGGNIGGMCEMDILLLSSRMGTEFYGILNATKPLNLLAFEALEVAARSVTEGIAFLQPRSASSHRGDMIVRDGRMWTGQNEDASGIALVEFANMFYTMNIVDCNVFMNFNFTNHFHTENILSAIFSRDLSYFQSFCDENWLFSGSDRDMTGLGGKGTTVITTPSIFDLIIFNDEIELLLLRLEYLKPYVTTHIIIESNTTFTGNPKPLHFLNNQALFAAYNVTSFTVSLDASARGIDDTEVWNREYFSRNRLFDALTLLNAGDEDIILVSDVDEIAHPRALETLVAIHSHAYTPPHASAPPIHSTGYRSRIHKLHQRTYMYDFDCFLSRKDETLSRTALTATTLGYAKQLFSTNNHDSLMTEVRKYQQATVPYALEDVLEPGGWHLTFFGGVQRIKSKLSSYSHRNIRRKFVSDEEDEKLDDYGTESEKFFTLISEKISNGDQIDGREKEKCLSSIELDEDTAHLKHMWEAVIMKMQRIQLN
jgi:beta-1,4-mannosyl-glycoprotein beta-1,4-N-acetylglucosaminyltransferase